MTPAKRRHRNLVIKPLLTVSYLLFFAIQLNSRYFSIANFFSYSGKSANTISSEVPAATGGMTAHTRIYKNSTHGAGTHLAIDKRFDSKDIVRTVLFCYQTIPSYTVVRSKFYTTAPEIISADPPILTLRGPPCA
jgi:hypothetical protein